jgi:hypothetical protein
MSSIQPSKLDLTIRKFRTFSETLAFTDDDNVALDLSSYTITAEIRSADSYSSDLIIALTIDDSDKANGNIVISLTEETTGEIDNASGYWDMLFVVGALKESWVEGEVNFKEAITNVT